MASPAATRTALFWIIPPLLIAILYTYISSTAIDINLRQCTALSLALGDKVLFPASTAYTQSTGSYWSKQEEALAPSCIVQPTSTDDVVTAVKTLTLSDKGDSSKCNFAVRSGGHTPWAGSANINDGVTIDLSSINSVTINNERTIAFAGAGAIWGDVYRTMDAQGLAVVGGRGSSIGIGGLLTGGGISFFSARKGFACDNVVNHEVVLSSGQVVNANATANSDLWIALKGGSNNFAIVTRFDLSAFSQGNFWGGSIVYADSASSQLLNAFAGLNGAKEFDEYAALILSFSYVTGTGMVAAANIEYTKPVINPPAFQPFTSIQPQYSNSMRISNQTDFTTEFIEYQPNGRRQMYVTNTFRNDLSFLNSVYAMFKSIATRLSTIPGLVFSLTVQPIPTATTSKSADLGGNSLGLDPSSDGALVLCLLSATWDAPNDDAQIASIVKTLNTQIIGAAKAKSLFNEWVYLNYAADFQDPMGGYGSTIRSRFKAVSQKYDPLQVFQKNVPGGFKLHS